MNRPKKLRFSDMTPNEQQTELDRLHAIGEAAKSEPRTPAPGGHPLARHLPAEPRLFVNMRIGNVEYSRLTAEHLLANERYHDSL